MARYRCILCIVLVLFVREAAAAKRKAPPDTRGRSPELTTLRASAPSYLLTGRSGQREVRYVSVEVRNIGDVGANDIAVSLPAAQGLTFPLRGPKKLAPRASAVYVSTVRVPSGVTLRGHAVITCSSCRK